MQKQINQAARAQGGAINEHTAELVLRHLIVSALGVLLSGAELAFGVHPFGIAFAAVAGEYFYATALGIAIYAILSGDLLTLVLLGVLTVLRVAISLFSQRRFSFEALFHERPLYRIAAAAVTVFGGGIYLVIRGGFRFYDLFAVLLAVAAAPLAATLYLGFLSPKCGLVAHHLEMGGAAVLLTAIFAIRHVQLFGIYPAAVASAAVAFVLVSHRDILWGTVGGALAGLCFDWRLAPAFLLCGLCFGLLEKSSRGGGVLAGSAAGCAYAFLLHKTAGIVHILPSLLVAGALFLAFDSAGLVSGAPVRHLMLARRRAATRAAGAAAGAASNVQLLEMSNALLDLSGTFYEISSRMRRPSLSSLGRLCDKAFDSVCAGCRNRELCWSQAHRETAAAVDAISKRLYTHGTVASAHVTGGLAKRCTELPRILSVINNGAASLTEEALHGDKTAVVAMDYAAMGRVLSEAITQNNEDFTCDTASGERIFSRLLRLGYSLESVAICGKARRRVILSGVRATGKSIRIRELRGVIEKYCHFSLGAPTIKEHEGLSDITFPEHASLTASFVKLTRPKGRGEGKHCGDSVTTLEGEHGISYALVCDGMGSGTAAALTSALASMFLSRLLQAGGRADSSLRMLNGFLAARSQRESENSTTVDLLAIDCVRGEAALYKCGAAPTFLLRRGEITHFFSRTAPVGILEALDAERIAFAVEEGDVLVQVSDGFTAGEEDCPWLAEMLKTRYDGDAEAFARMALNHATKEGNDDLSIIVTEIKAAPLPFEAAPRQSA